MDETRIRILRAVLNVIGTDGIRGVTNRRIARDADVSPGSLTYWFDSQEDMLRKSLALYVREEVDRLIDLTIEMRRAKPSPEEAAATVEQVAESITFGPTEIGALELFLYAGRNEMMREVATGCWVAYDQVAQTVLTGLGVEDPEPLIGPVVALIAGLQLRRLATGTPGDTGIADALLMLVDKFLPTK